MPGIGFLALGTKIGLLDGEVMVGVRSLLLLAVVGRSLGDPIGD
jgi:hypothetical protein